MFIRIPGAAEKPRRFVKLLNTIPGVISAVPCIQIFVNKGCGTKGDHLKKKKNNKNQKLTSRLMYKKSARGSENTEI